MIAATAEHCDEHHWHEREQLAARSTKPQRLMSLLRQVTARSGRAGWLNSGKRQSHSRSQRDGTHCSLAQPNEMMWDGDHNEASPPDMQRFVPRHSRPQHGTDCSALQWGALAVYAIQRFRQRAAQYTLHCRLQRVRAAHHNSVKLMQLIALGNGWHNKCSALQFAAHRRTQRFIAWHIAGLRSMVRRVAGLHNMLQRLKTYRSLSG